MQLPVHRRQLLQAGVGSLAAGLSLAGTPAATNAQDSSRKQDAFRYCLNTSTIRGQKLPLVEEISLASNAGYQGIEPWIREITQYQESGGKLTDLRKRLSDAGLTVESAIGFANWIVDDDAQRARGLEDAKRDMALVREIGGTRIAAPPAGARAAIDLNAIAERYAKLLELGAQMGVTPQLELWGPSKAISRLGQMMFVASEAGHPDACMLPDVYHIFKGGSDFHGLQVINGQAIHCFHMNDYPADPPRATIGDKDRVYPGDGIAPLSQILNTLYDTGFRGALSLELFNPSYWEQDPAVVVRTGIAKMRAAVARAFA